MPIFPTDVTQEPHVEEKKIEIAVKGRWVRVPALKFNDKDIVVRGRWLKTALVEGEEWLDTPLENPAHCLQVLKKRQSTELRADIFTFTQKLPSVEPMFDYYHEFDSVAAIRLSTFDQWWVNLPSKTRKNIRRAQCKGVVIKIKSRIDRLLLEGIRQLNNDCPVRQGRPFTHFGKTLEEVEKDQQSFLDRCDYICAYLDDELIGFTKLIYRGDVASILTFLSKQSQNYKRPANAMMAAAVELCTQRNIAYLVYGNFNYGNKRETPLREFKIRNGFKEVLLPRYYVPLSMKGRIALKLKLHRGAIGLLPHGLITAVVSARSSMFKLATTHRRGRLLGFLR